MTNSASATAWLWDDAAVVHACGAPTYCPMDVLPIAYCLRLIVQCEEPYDTGWAT